MSATKWTKEQLEAIETKNCNLLVAAAAGSGKTAVLVERIVRMITDEENPIDIDKLLVVTFTNAAASEMRERIGNALSKKLCENPGSRVIQKQLALLGKAKITTIHAFCLDVIKNNFHMLDLDPDFRVGDETEVLLLKNETLEELFEDKYLQAEYTSKGINKNNNSMEFLKLVECYCGNKSDDILFNMIMNLYSFVMSNPEPYTWLTNASEKFNVGDDFKFEDSIWADVLKQNIKIQLLGMENQLKVAIEIINECPSIENYRENFESELFMIEALIKASESFGSLKAQSLNIEFKKLKRCPKGVDKEKQSIVKSIRDGVKKSLSSISDDMLLQDDEEIKEEFKGLYPLMKTLSELIIEFDIRYKDKKKKRGIIDFNDFEHMCLSIIVKKDDDGNIIPSDTALKIREKYDEILIDEYQDSNMVQEVILGTISRKDTENPNLFMVGDVKQSIYRFRQANPGIFLDKYNSYKTADGEKDRKVLLYKNFRSRKEILDAVNFVFKQIMSRNIGELDYNDQEKLNLGANYEEIDEKAFSHAVELNIIEKNEVKEEAIKENDEDEENVDNIMLEARLIGKRILELINSFKVLDKNTSTYRKAQFKDIVILLRSTKGWADVFSDELKNMGIPVFSDTNSGYFETPEVKTMLSLLQIIDNPRQDIPMTAVLKSPIGGFTVEDLIDIKGIEGITFYDKLKNAAENGDDEFSIKVREFLSKLHKWRKESLYTPIDEFIWYLYTDTGYYGYVGAVSGGIQRQANLKMLFQRAKIYSETSYKGLFNFINFINKLKLTSGDMGSAKILGENENVVRIMSIHKSKGLEFPIVFVSGCGKNFNFMDMNNPVLFNDYLGFGPEYVDYKRRISHKTLVKEAIKNKIKLETLSEEMRILYVAFTRAKEKLIITGSVKDVQKAAFKWSMNLNVSSDKISEDFILKSKSFLDWIASAVIRHKDAEKLREAAGEVKEGKLIDDESNWKIEMWSREDILTFSEPSLEDEENTDDRINLFYENLNKIKGMPYESNYAEEIKNRLEYKYPHKKASELPALLSVTELKRRMNQQNDDYAAKIFTPPLSKKPHFLEEVKKLTPAERGTAMHSVMQHLALHENMNAKDIKNQVDNMVIGKILTEKQAQSVNIRRILKFFENEIGKRVIKSQNVYREFPFQMRVKSTDIYKSLPKEYEGEEIVVQGIIDLFFKENNEIILVDYKNDYVNDDNIDDIIKKYTYQINYYEKALEIITGLKVKEKYLYLFYSGDAVKIQ
ncbi:MULTISPECIES: helicase-exonuclease AddAB subunit AddA [Clostridium]|uniref:helicase-exonuclease AddAB subunit AddA n=1 Tax=Clostridium TaxID=1485 RepID=UPI000826FE95|nr:MULTISPECIES: helicase-exonuclease AddAB subunit AddA [Clostridium]PJI09772.1 helicase-exonuclease AddAB subunit AddA [Clostridium sp. CT7]